MTTSDYIHSVIMHNCQTAGSKPHRTMMTAIEIYKHLTINLQHDITIKKFNEDAHNATLSPGYTEQRTNQHSC